jgi:hypothetical protein
MKTPPVQIPTYDPFTGYEIRAYNDRYNGDCNGVRFIDGKGVVDALPRDADEEEQAERVNQLLWFFNSAPAMKYVPDAKGNPVRQYFPGYVIEPKSARRKELAPA